MKAARRNIKKLSHTETPPEKEWLDSLVERAAAALSRGQSPAAAFPEAELAALRSRYSHFRDELDQAGFLTLSTHRVTKVATPRPYIHLIGSSHSHERGCYGSFWDASGAGFACLDAVLAGPVTSHKDPSYVPTAPRVTDHRNFYLREEVSSGQVRIWHAFPQRGVEENRYSAFCCDQGLGTVEISARRNRVLSRLLVFVPPDHPLEVWRLEIANLGRKPRKLDLFIRVNWGLESYPGYYFDPRVVSQGRHYPELNALVALNHDQNNRHPRTGFLMSEQAFESFDLSAEEFTGGGHFKLFPRAVEEGACRYSLGVQPYLGLIGALHFRLELPPGAGANLDFLLGVTDPDLEKGRLHLAGLRRHFFRAGGMEKELGRLQEHWRIKIDSHKLDSPDSELNRFFNVWSKYQAHNTARWTRALDKVGYRDLLQDLRSINSFDPRYTAVMLPVALRHQFPDGRAVRQFAKFPGTDHDMRMYMDSSSWIPDTLVNYLEETGDLGLLEKEETFLDPETGRTDTLNKASIYEHALRGVKALYTHRGLHGLCRIGHGDWNDALDGVGKGGEGVSVWLSMALVYAAGKMLELARFLKDRDNAAFLERIITELTAAINRSAWDGEHYVYAFMPDGTAVGSNKSLEGRIHLNVNAWSLFNGVAESAGRTSRVLRSIERLRTPLGYLLLFPGYTARSRKVGRIADMPPGQFENASIYTHGQSFVAYALAGLGLGNEACRALKMILPENTLPDIASGPPHQVSNFTVGIEHEHYGRNLYSNFSGALAWLRKSLERMLGLLPAFDGLVIDPCVPSDWLEFRVEKVFRGCRVRAHFKNPDGVCRGLADARIDGERLALREGKARIPLEMLKGRKKVQLEVRLSAK